MEDNGCHNCKHWMEVGVHNSHDEPVVQLRSGECRRYPPKDIQVVAEGKVRWPLTLILDDCGEWHGN